MEKLRENLDTEALEAAEEDITVAKEEWELTHLQVDWIHYRSARIIGCGGIMMNTLNNLFYHSFIPSMIPYIFHQSLTLSLIPKLSDSFPP